MQEKCRQEKNHQDDKMEDMPNRLKGEGGVLGRRSDSELAYRTTAQAGLACHGSRPAKIFGRHTLHYPWEMYGTCKKWVLALLKDTLLYLSRHVLAAISNSNLPTANLLPYYNTTWLTAATAFPPRLPAAI